MPIQKVHARQIFDSRGNPTVEVEITTEAGVFRAAVPSGASTGENEACELRDGGKDYMGKGVSKAVDNVKSKIAPALIGKDPADQQGIDKIMIDLDATENKTNLGANAILGVSMACCRAGAAQKGLPLFKHINEIAGKPLMSMPVPCFNVINGGVHAGNFLAFQEFFLIPVGAKTFAEAMKLGSETYHNLKGIIKKKYGLDSTAVGDEGGFAPAVADPEEGLKLLLEAISQAGHEGKILIGSDPASSEFWKGDEQKYDMDFKSTNPKPENKKSREEMVATYKRFCDTYPIALLEDPFAEEDFEGHSQLTALVGDKVEIVGDDLYCTNVKRVQMGLDKKATNAPDGKSLNFSSIFNEAISGYAADEASILVALALRTDVEETEVLFMLFITLAEGAKVKSLEAAISSAIKEALAPTGEAANGTLSSPAGQRLTEEEIRYMLSLAREGGDGLSRIEVHRIRKRDPLTGEEYDGVFYNESYDKEGTNICHQDGDRVTPTAAVIEKAERLLENDAGVLLAKAVAAYIRIAEYLGKELYHMEAEVGSATPPEEPSGTTITRMTMDWLEKLNEMQAEAGQMLCPNNPEFLLVCIKQTNCLLEIAAEADPHGITPGRMATYLEVEKEVTDHYEEFAIQAQIGLPHMPGLCEQETASIASIPNTGSLLQSESTAAKVANSERQSRAVAAVFHTQRAAARTVRALADHSKLHLLEESFFTHTWKKACELIGCWTTSFVDIMDASAGHIAELVDVNASWHAVKTHHVGFMQFRTSVWQAMNASSDFHTNFRKFIYGTGRAKGARRVDHVYKEASDVLSTALALERQNADSQSDSKAGRRRSSPRRRGRRREFFKVSGMGAEIYGEGWWCLSWRANEFSSFQRKFPFESTKWGAAVGYSMAVGDPQEFEVWVQAMKGNHPAVFELAVGLTIGFIPSLPTGQGVRAGVTVGGTLTLATNGPKVGIKLGLGVSAVNGIATSADCSPKRGNIGGFKCMKGVSASFTIFCKSFDFSSGDSDAQQDDPCSTDGKYYKEIQRRRVPWNNKYVRRRETNMPGQGRSSEKNAVACRDRCNRVSGCMHYTFYQDGGCHLQSRDSELHGGWYVRSGPGRPEDCCAVPKVWWAIDHNRRRRRRWRTDKGQPHWYTLDGRRRGKSHGQTLQQCQQRCASVSWCRHFTFWQNGGCHITDAHAKSYINHGQSPQASGPPRCR
ncbi:ENO2 [Symbiodinium microadriaticum]|nr:ENO2 [Symbiodinium microadriaticum]